MKHSQCKGIVNGKAVSNRLVPTQGNFNLTNQ